MCNCGSIIVPCHYCYPPAEVRSFKLKVDFDEIDKRLGIALGLEEKESK
jgi:hypothetical protein